MIRAASCPKRGAILNFKSERAAALNFNAAASMVLNFKCTPALNFKSEQNAPLNFTPERSPALNFNLGSLNFRSRCDEFYRAFLARGSCGTAILSDEILSSRGKNFKAQSSKSGGMKFLKPKFRGEQKEDCDAKYR
ncbi:hypothetical protein [uncultured Campylobacter sp.]|uniref:hypothetical protein n=1 Tax=uncultured Campylobacter sp. TaxID=218934 RepID=UPI00262F72ED|nr:hypothetical protein [uncultured Campylobacter sp.]